MFPSLTLPQFSDSTGVRFRALLCAAALVVSLHGFAQRLAGDATKAGENRAAVEPAKQKIRKPKIPQLGADKLPWSVPPATPSSEVEKRTIVTARDLFPSIKDWSQFVDNRPLTSDETNTIQQLLFHIPLIEHYRLYRLQEERLSWPQLMKQPAAHRASVFRLAGRVKRVQRMTISSDDAYLLEYKHYFLVTMRLDDAPHDVKIFTRQIPQVWQSDRKVDYRAGVTGLFLKMGSSVESAGPAIFAAARIAWFPDREDKKLGVTADVAWLGELGMDVGLLETVRRLNRRKLTAEDSDSFYQLLSAVGRAKAKEMQRRAPDEFKLTSLLQNPQRHHGRLMVVEGNARKVTRISIDEADIQSRFGIDHYYQIDVLVPLHNQHIRLGKDTKDKQAPRFTSSFPVTICVRRLPDNLKKIVAESEDNLNERIRVPVFFYKIWTYTSQFITEHDRGNQQVSPMLIGLEPQLVSTETHSNPYLSIVTGLIFAAALVGIWWGIWRYNRADKQFSRDTLRRQYELKEGQSLNDMGIQAKDGPDFSNLD